MPKYTIKRNRHYHSNIWQRLLFLVRKKQQHYKAEFSESCWYSKEKVKNSGYNKLFGMGSANPKKNSARIVWLPDFDQEGQFRLFSYIYENGKRFDPVPLTIVKVNESFEAIISADKNKYIIRAKGVEVEQSHNKIKTGFRLQPYFGGKDKAYNTMVIKLNKS